VSDHWRMAKQSDVGWTDIWVTSFDWIDRIETEIFPVMGRDYTGVSVGRVAGMRATMTVLVRDATEDTALMAVLKGREIIALESSLGHIWDVRVASDIERKQNLAATPAGSPYPVKHEFFVTFKIVQVTTRSEPVPVGGSEFDEIVFNSGELT
jgi:hypothetical protein